MSTVDRLPGAATGAGLSILSHVGVHRGLGHLNRQLTILRALHRIDPTVRIGLHLATPDVHLLRDNEFRIHVGDPENPEDLLRAIEEQRADALLFDTFLPRVRPPRIRFPNQRPPAIALTLRRVFPDRLRPILSNPWMEWTRLVLLPHAPPEFQIRLPERLHAEVVHTGPIVREVDSSAAAGVARRYRIEPGQPLIVATTGGGGIPSYFERFRSAVLDGFAVAREKVPGLRMIFVTGPQNEGIDPVLPGVEVVPFEPQMPALMGLARLVIAHTGYNTTNEIVSVGTPALFLPMVTKYDDGIARARVWQREGVAHAIEDLSAVATAAFLVDYFGRPDREGRMRAARQALALDKGAEVAAAHLHRLLLAHRAEERAVRRPLFSDAPAPGVGPTRTANSRTKPKPAELPRHTPFVVPVLAYRWVGPDPDGPGCASPAEFDQQMDWLANFAKVVPLSTALERLQAGGGPLDGSVVLTFDEAYADLLDSTFTRCRQADLSATVFLPTRHLGRWDEWNTRGSRIRQHLTWEDAADLRDAGFEIGVHSRNHQALVKFDKPELKKELLGAVRDVQESLGVTPQAVAYPHGIQNDLVCRIAARAFAAGFVGSTGGSNDWRSKPHCIRRIQVMPHWTLEEFAHAVHGHTADPMPARGE